MLPKLNSILYTIYAWFLGMCYGFVIISSAAGQNGDIKLFEPGESQLYRWHSMILLNEKISETKNVGFYIEGDLKVETVWGSNSDRIIKLNINSPQLHVRSRKAPTPDGFVPHSSNLEKFSNQPFVLFWRNGKIEEIYLPKNEPQSLSNLKKGISSLLQFQFLNKETEEVDSSGRCNVKYSLSSPNKLFKTKSECMSENFDFHKLNSENLLNSVVDSTRRLEYELDSSSSFLKSVTSIETHKMYIKAKEELGSVIEVEQKLSHMRNEKGEVINEDTIESVIDQISKNERITFTRETLLIVKEQLEEEIPKFTKEVEKQRENLQTELLGSLKPAKAFLHLVDIARVSTKDDITKTLASKKNKKILPQLYDILGYAQTEASHQAVIGKLHFGNEEQIDLSERYLWALSLSPQPQSEIISDLLNKYKKYIDIPEKVKETLILTIASMTRRLSRSSTNQHLNLKIIRTVEETILNNLEYAKGEERFVYFRALKNLRSPSTIQFLINFVKNGSSKEGVLAWKALKSFDRELWNNDLLKTAQRTLFQMDKYHDTSSRAIAAEILLQSNLTDERLVSLLNFVASNDTIYEVRQYVFQNIRMLAEKDENLNKKVQQIIKNNKFLHNYSALSPRGLSTALRRSFFASTSSNGSLVSIQEIKSGIVKRGIVNIVLEKDDIHEELFSLGIFSGGLGNLISSDSEGEEEESATAGMELDVLGTQIRPFVFFSGQGELMGHVWSGTASERTTAFQALISIQDFVQYLPLGSGFVVQLSLKGAASFDLSGKIEISLWNRNSEALVEKSAGILFTGSMKIDTSFVRSNVEFSASVEPKLTLHIDADFSSGIKLCMRLTQPECLYRHNIFKIERIPGSKHKMRIAKYKKINVPGKTYSLNRKNNEMCSAIFG